MLHVRRIAILTLAVAFAIIGAFPVAVPTPVANAALLSMSEQQEIQVGREVERQLAQRPGFVDDPGLTQYLREIVLIVLFQHPTPADGIMLGTLTVTVGILGTRLYSALRTASGSSVDGPSSGVREVAPSRRHFA